MKITTEVSKKLQFDLGSIANSIKDNSSPFHCHLALAMAMCRRWNSILELEDRYRWRDIKVELPEYEGDYLIWPPNKYAGSTCCFNKYPYENYPENKFIDVSEYDEVTEIHVTHWMPMPKFEVER